jgi:uncharacterized membrane-anchored protein
MDLMQLLMAVLVSGGVVAFAFQFFKKGLAWVEAMSPAKKRLAIGVLSLAATGLSLVMKQDLPADVTQWGEPTVQAILTFAVTQVGFLLKKALEKKTAA